MSAPVIEQSQERAGAPLGAAPGPLRRVLAVAVVLVLLLGLLTLAYRYGGAAGTQTSDLPPEFDALAELYQNVTGQALDVPEDAELARGALEGLLGTLDDPYAEYYDAEDFRRFSGSLDGEFSGVGIRVEETPDGLVVVSVLPDSPAERAGIEAGERITSVDGEDVTDLPAAGVVELITGEVGTSVRLGLDRGSQGRRELELTRERLELPEVESERLDSGYGYVSIRTFSRHVDTLLREHVGELTGAGAPGIILDLRGNPGGLLTEAVEVASVFVEDGTVVTVDGGEGIETYEARGDALDVPLVVLIDEFSASASEIVAGAFADLGRARLVGAPTFGKGTVQTVLEVGDGGVKFTTAEYFTPSGDSIEGLGVQPDVTVRGTPEEVLAAGEAALTSLLAGEPVDAPAGG